MKIRHYLVLCAAIWAFTGCSPQKKEEVQPATIDPRSTVGSLSRIYATESIQVRGIGIVAGLAGTGSSECPADIREELEKYIWKQIPQKGTVNPRALIESLDTAVVEVVGTVPYLSDKTQGFDIMVRPLSSTQTTSLDGGYLYTTELKEMSRLARVEQFSQYSKTIATASGPIYSNKMKDRSDGKMWCVMGGGKSTGEPSVKLILNKTDFLGANAVRNRINERFGPKICVPESASECTLYFPARYKNDKMRFLRIVNSLVLGNSDQIREEYTVSALNRLISEPNKIDAEITLEGIGKSALDRLEPLLKHDDAKVRFHAARCMLNIGSDKPVQYLRQVASDPKNAYRIEALGAIGLNSKDAGPLLMSALSDANLDVRLAAYEMLVRLDSPLVLRKTVGGGNFVVDTIVCDGPKIIYAYQKDSPRIVLFGAPIQCDKNLFVQSDDGTITLNALPDDKYISVSRKHPGRPRVIGPIKSSFELSILIQTLGEMPEISNNSGLRPGLAVAYADILPLLKKMCDQDAIKAKFIAGPEFEQKANVQNSGVQADTNTDGTL